MNLARSSCSSTHAGPVDVLGAPWVCQAGPDLASIYLHARYYDSSLGMFLSPDPAGADSNSYRYGGGDPANFVDPTGLCKQNPETGEYYDCPVFPGGVAVCGDTGLTAATEDDCAWLQDEYNWNNGGWSSSFWNYMNNNAYPAPRPRVRYYFERPVVDPPPIVIPTPTPNPTPTPKPLDLGLHEEVTVSANYHVVEQRLAAFWDGFVPFYDPFDGLYGNCFECKWSRTIGEVTFGAEVAVVAGPYVNNNPILRFGRGRYPGGEWRWRIASGGRWGKGGPKLPWHWHWP